MMLASWHVQDSHSFGAASSFIIMKQFWMDSSAARKKELEKLL